MPEKTLLDRVYEVFEAFKRIPQEDITEAQDRLVLELRALNEGEAEFHNREIERIRTEYDRTQSRIQTLLDMRLDKSITHDDYDKVAGT